MIKKQETAIKKLLTGEQFKHKKFELFRDNFEVALVAVRISKEFHCDVWNLSDRLMDNLQLIREAVSNKTSAMDRASERIRLMVESSFPDYQYSEDCKKGVLKILDIAIELEGHGIKIPHNTCVFWLNEKINLLNELQGKCQINYEHNRQNKLKI